MIKKYTKTQYTNKVFSEEESNFIFSYLKENIKWEDGIYSKKNGFTRKAKSLTIEDDDVVRDTLLNSLKRLKLKNYVIFGIYLNYYRNGTEYCPSHAHPGTVQLVISFNEKDGERTLTVGKKEYEMKNGSVLMFGSSVHGIKKDEKVKAGRISIATFMRYDESLKDENAFIE